MDGLDKYQVLNEILDMKVEDIPKDAQYKILKMQSKLLVSRLGEESFNDCYKVVDSINEDVIRYLQGKKSVVVDVECGKYRVTGVLRENVGENSHHYFVTMSSYAHKVWVEALVEHLLLTIQLGVDISTSVISKGKEVASIDVHCDEAKELLLKLLNIFLEGQTKVLPIFEYSTMEYGQTLDLDKAKEKFLIPSYVRNEYGHDLFSKAVTRFFDESFWDNSDNVDDFERYAKIIYGIEG